MKQKYGKFYADWRDEDGTRRTKSFTTIGEALAWKEAHRRKQSLKRHPTYATAEQRHAANLRKHYRWRQREALKNPLRGLFRKLGLTEYDCRKNGLTTIGIRDLIAPTWLIVSHDGKCTTDRLESPEHLAQRLGLTDRQRII